MILCGATTSFTDATSSSSPCPSSTSSTAANKTNTILSKLSKYNVKQPHWFFHTISTNVVVLNRNLNDWFAAFSLAALFVLLNFANWQCVDAVVASQNNALAPKLWPQLALNRHRMEVVVDSQFKRDELLASHKRGDSKTIDSPTLNNRPLPDYSECVTKSTCLSTTPSSMQYQQVESGWWASGALPVKRTFRKRFASESVMKREVYPLPGDPPIILNGATSSLHRQSFLGPRNIVATSSDGGRTNNDTTTIIQTTTITHPVTSIPETSSLVTTPNLPQPAKGEYSPSPSSSPTVDRFKTSIAFEAAAKQRYNQQENHPHYGGRPNESDTSYPGHILRSRPNATISSAMPTFNGSGKGKSEDSLSNDNDDDIVVTLLGLFELSTKNDSMRSEGHSELAAARLAVRHINKLHLLPGYRLELVTNDTKVSGHGGGVMGSSE